MKKEIVKFKLFILIAVSGFIVFLVMVRYGLREQLDQYDQIQPRKYHFTTEKGLECVGPLSSPSCNWEAWNLKTNYGMYPNKEKR